MLFEGINKPLDILTLYPLLGKCFEGINKVHFEADAKITKIISQEGEVIDLDTSIDPETSANKGNAKRLSWYPLDILTLYPLFR